MEEENTMEATPQTTTEESPPEQSSTADNSVSPVTEEESPVEQIPESGEEPVPEEPPGETQIPEDNTTPIAEPPAQEAEAAEPSAQETEAAEPPAQETEAAKPPAQEKEADKPSEMVTDTNPTGPVVEKVNGISGGDDTDSFKPLSPVEKRSPPATAPKPRTKSTVMYETHGHMTAEQMDEQRKQNIAYEYLCHLEESKVWIQACINEELPPTTELEEGLRNGVYLAKLAHFMAPVRCPLKRIYDKEQTRFKGRGLHFRHTDNINHWLAAMGEVGLPAIFYPETTDIYDRKNMPRTIYCLHALSLYLFKLGMAPQIEDLYGKVNFTDEEISAMRQALDKYGIQMPTFSKIGGILANELSVDDAALHAAIIAINEAIENQVAKDTMFALSNNAAMLVSLSVELQNRYQDILFEAKQTKADVAKTKSSDPNKSVEFDVYDEMLTQAEIQGNLNKVNTLHSLECLNQALLKAIPAEVLQMLKSAHLGIKNVKDENVDFYMTRLQEAAEVKRNNNNGEAVALEKDEIQQAVNQANLDADTEYQKSLAVVSINTAIQTSDKELLMKTLQHPRSQLPPVYDFAAPLYMEEFASMREEKEADLDYDEIFAAVRVLSAIAGINKAVDTGDGTGTYNALSATDACIPNLDENNADRYQKSLNEAKTTKREKFCTCLTHHEITDAVDQVNSQVEEEHERIMAINTINEAIEQGSPADTLQALKLSTAKLEDVEDDQAYHYQVLLIRKKKQKAEETHDESASLWLDEIQSSINSANEETRKGLKMSMVVAAINDAVDAHDVEALSASLTSPDVEMTGVLNDCSHTYLEDLQELKKSKQDSGTEMGSGWMMNRTKQGFKFFFNTRDLTYSWNRTDDIKKDCSLLTKEEIQGVVSGVTAQHNRELLFEANEDFIIKVQALMRGYLTRKAFRNRMTYIKDQEPSVVKLQAFWKGTRQRRVYQKRKNYLEENAVNAIRIQAVARMWFVRRKFLDRLKYFKDHEADVVKIQAFVRSNQARHDYRALMFDENPPVSVVLRFVHLLDTSDTDYAEELDLQRLRQQVVKAIKSNKQLEYDLDQMDVKIGLLIKNRITLQDVVTQNKKLAKQASESTNKSNRGSTLFPRGLKVLSKESHDRLEAYQHLFYHLQTHPQHLAKLIFEMPQKRTTKFMESVIYSLFNYGSNVREEYLLLKLFKTALEEEIISKVEKMTDIVSGNPLVVKMIVGFNRGEGSQNALKDMLYPLVTDVVADKSLKINTSPVEVYKVWVNQMESETGKTSELPYDVTMEQALEHEAVKQQLDESISKLQELTNRFLTCILTSLDKIPYGMRYMAKVLRAALKTKFPEAQDKDVLKIVGNLLYYRYINPAILAPDGFDIINVGADKALSTDLRRNLGSVARILQFIAANKGFGGDSSYLSSMNPYIREAHEKFKTYCIAACDVVEPDVKFNIDQYSELTLISKPVIYISVQEIVDTHQLLLEHQGQIAPDNSDPIHELLEELGEIPSGHDLLGVEMSENENLEEQIHQQLAKTEISLTLTNKFEVPDDDQIDIKTLLIRTKRMVVDIIACQQGETLAIILDTASSDEHEEFHQALVKKRDNRDKRLAKTEGSIVRQQSMSGDCRLPLKMMKTKVMKSLKSLELENMVSRKDGYQAIVNLIAQDIRNQSRYRRSRKLDLQRIRITLKALADKRVFIESQVDYYNQYVKTCVENLQKKGSVHKAKAKANKTARKAHGTIKYSGAKLQEKGVILEIEGLSQNQFKNVQFEIAATSDPGVFEVSAKFMGVDVEKVELIFQDLLQLQYEGVAVMEMFGKTKINVNLLIFLINRKFYSNTRK